MDGASDETPSRGVADLTRELDALFRVSPIGLAHLALDGTWLRVNQSLCELVGYSADELLQRGFQDVTHPDDLERDLDHAGRLLAGEIDDYRLEKRYLHRAGHEVPVLVVVTLVRDDHGDPRHFVSQIVAR